MWISYSDCYLAQLLYCSSHQPPKEATHIINKFKVLASHSPGYHSLLLDIVDNDDDYDK